MFRDSSRNKKNHRERSDLPVNYQFDTKGDYRGFKSVSESEYLVWVCVG